MVGQRCLDIVIFLLSHLMLYDTCPRVIRAVWSHPDVAADVECLQSLVMSNIESGYTICCNPTSQCSSSFRWICRDSATRKEDLEMYRNKLPLALLASVKLKSLS